MGSGHRRPRKVGWRGAGGLVVAVSALAILIPGAASGAGFLKYNTISSDAPSNSVRATFTPCSGNFKFRAGGGIKTEFGHWFGIAFGSMEPAGNGFTTVVQNLEGSPIPAVDTAICSSARTELRAKAFSLRGDEKVHSATVKCKSNETVLSGGFDVGPPDGPRIPIESYPVDGSDRGKTPDDGWKTSAVNFSNKVMAQAFAICIKSSKVKVGYEKDNDLVIADGGAQTPRGILCSGKQRVVGGGVRETGGSRTRTGIGASFPFDAVTDTDSVPDDGWEVTMNGSFSSGPVPAVLYAVCAEPR